MKERKNQIAQKASLHGSSRLWPIQNRLLCIWSVRQRWVWKDLKEGLPVYISWIVQDHGEQRKAKSTLNLLALSMYFLEWIEVLTAWKRFLYCAWGTLGERERERERESEREREREIQREIDGSHEAIVALKLAVSFALFLAINLHLSIIEEFCTFLANKYHLSFSPLEWRWVHTLRFQ